MKWVGQRIGSKEMHGGRPLLIKVLKEDGHRRHGQPSRFIFTLVRDPIARSLSRFVFWRHKEWHAELVRCYGFSDYTLHHDSDDNAQFRDLIGGRRRSAGCGGGLYPSQHLSGKDWHDVCLNGTKRQLLGDVKRLLRDDPGASRLLVGRVERFDEAFVLLSHFAFGACGAPVDLRYCPRNTVTGAAKPAALSVETLARLRRTNALDYVVLQAVDETMDDLAACAFGSSDRFAAAVQAFRESTADFQRAHKCANTKHSQTSTDHAHSSDDAWISNPEKANARYCSKAAASGSSPKASLGGSPRKKKRTGAERRHHAKSSGT